MDSKTLLLIDDEVHITFMLAYKLRAKGYLVHTAINGDDGFELARQIRPDLVVADLQMPGTNGFDMSVQLSQCSATANIPIIMLTGCGYKVSEAERQLTNIRYMMDKPFSANELLSKIHNLLEVNNHTPQNQSDREFRQAVP